MKADNLAREEFAWGTASSEGRFSDHLQLLQTAALQLEQRLAQLVAHARKQVRVDDPLSLKALVITDDEIDQILGERQRGIEEPQYEVGSLLEPLLSRWDGNVPSRLREMQRRFDLSTFELECVFVCLVPELDRRFGRIYGYLNDDVTLKYPSIDLLLMLLAPSLLRVRVRCCLSRDSRLVRNCILVPTGDARAAAHPAALRVADGVVRYLLEQGSVDAMVTSVWCQPDDGLLAGQLWERQAAANSLTALIRSHLINPEHTPLVVVVKGRRGSGRRYAVEQACDALGLSCISLDSRQIKRVIDLEGIVTAAARDSLLIGAPLFLHHANVFIEDTARCAEFQGLLTRIVNEMGWVLVLGMDDDSSVSAWFRAARFLEIEMHAPKANERRDGWFQLLTANANLERSEVEALSDGLAVKFRLTYGEMAEVLQRVQDAPAMPCGYAGWSAALHRQAAAVAAPRLSTLAHHIEVGARFDDLVLPSDKRELLIDIARRVRHRGTVFEDWAFERLSSRGRGLVVLFHGPSGTGKTMAAEVIAGELEMPLFRVDLAGVVSKYIGETEKNLRTVFDEAERANAVLFFDEADALFGKRSEVKDAHDRYANIEINYLLTRIEQFEGVAILATNVRHHLDEAFLRRIHVTVEFALPRLNERRSIWIKSFPSAAPVDADVDYEFLSSRFEVSGGAIRNAALGAAFLAAEGRRSIGMGEIVRALRSELVKAGRRVVPAEFGSYAGYLEPPAPAQRTQPNH